MVDNILINGFSRLEICMKTSEIKERQWSVIKRAKLICKVTQA
jgi:hypothetical protein